jgi:protein-S-isoprenylcysteine O-methyltransferase Ste14
MWPANPVDLVRADWRFALLGALASVAWVAGEYYARRLTWRKGAPRPRSSHIDQSTYPIIAVGLVVSLAADAVVFLLGPSADLPLWVAGLGLALMGTGLGLRIWAMATLGRFFTNPITIRDDQYIVRDGPYRRLRHPAYTGGLLLAIGLPLVLGSALAFGIALVACGFAYIWRIRIEERVLLERFGPRYVEYQRETSRLVPGLY